MRLKLLPFLISSALSHFLCAQNSPVNTDYYVLKESPGVQNTDWFQFVSSSELLTKNKSGKKYTLLAKYVVSCRVQQRTFITVGGFEVHKGLSKTLVEGEFAEVIDTGRVILLRYNYATGVPVLIPAGGGGIVGSLKLPHTLYLLRDSVSTVLIPPYAHRDKGQEQRAALRPYVATRPDLLDILDSKIFGEYSLPAIIRALNSNQPFISPPAPAPFGVD